MIVSDLSDRGLKKVSQDEYVIGVDVGGTKIACALVDRRGRTHATLQAPTHAPGLSVSQCIAQAIGNILGDASGKQVSGIGIGCPGQVNALTGTVKNAVNVGWIDEINLRREVQALLPVNIPIWIGRDTNALALGERYYGDAGDNFVLLAIGTGLGAAAIVDGKPLLGTANFAMELGHFALIPQGRRCTCGLDGCPEMYVSGTGLLAGVAEHRTTFPRSPLSALYEQGNLTTTDILHAARQNDDLGKLVLHEAAVMLGKLMAFCAVTFNPARIVIAGGLGRAAADLLLPEAEQTLRSSTLAATHSQLQITLAQVDSAIGASCLAWESLSDRF